MKKLSTQQKSTIKNFSAPGKPPNKLKIKSIRTKNVTVNLKKNKTFYYTFFKFYYLRSTWKTDERNINSSRELNKN